MDLLLGHQACAWTHPLPWRSYASELSPAATIFVCLQEVYILCKKRNLLVSFNFGFGSILVDFPTSAARGGKVKIDAFNPGLLC